jgi:fatty acid desaturase
MLRVEGGIEGTEARLSRCDRQNARSMPRAAWTLIVLVALLTAALLLLAGYTGYAVLSLCVGASASINLF